VSPEDFLLTKEEVSAKYADKGSPDYPTHHKGCGCSGCYASWVEWRGGYAAVQAERTRVASLQWEDAEVPDEWTEQIKAAFPTRSGSHDEYAKAMKMVGSRHSKGELVALVNWLLVSLKKAREAA
jgi:hypothetical protein